MVLATGGWGNGDQLREDHEDRDSAEPDGKVAIDDTCGATILKANEEKSMFA